MVVWPTQLKFPPVETVVLAKTKHKKPWPKASSITLFIIEFAIIVEYSSSGLTSQNIFDYKLSTILKIKTSKADLLLH